MLPKNEIRKQYFQNTKTNTNQTRNIGQIYIVDRIVRHVGPQLNNKVVSPCYKYTKQNTIETPEHNLCQFIARYWN